MRPKPRQASLDCRRDDLRREKSERQGAGDVDGRYCFISGIAE